MQSRSKQLAQTAIDACIAAIEVYNKPDFRHREEAFAILMVNAWELLLKARILKENKNKLSSIWMFEKIKKADGTPGNRLVVKANRTGNPLTIDIGKAVEKVRSYGATGINEACAENIHLLTEIRDKATHFMNEDAGLSQRMQEVGTAALRNFMHAAQGDIGNGTDKARFLMKVRHFLEQHRDHISIQKLRRNEQLTAQDLAELERMFLHEGIGDADDLERIRQEGGLGLFVRSLIGLDREAAKQALSTFIGGRALSANQIEFVTLIIDHLTDRGIMDARRLYESPFTDIDDQGVSGVFPAADVKLLISVLDEVRGRTAA